MIIKQVEFLLIQCFKACLQLRLYLADLVNVSETTFQNSMTLVRIVVFSHLNSVSTESKTNLKNNIQPELPIIQLWQKK